MLQKPLLTIITPVFNEAGNLDRYFDQIRALMDTFDDLAVEVLFIDDGSRDGSWAKVRTICSADERFHALRLSRNFGAHVALAAGLREAKGDAVAILACDLQDPPDVVRQFVAEWRAGASIVWGRRRSRQDSLLRSWLSCGFNWVLKRFAMPAGSQFTTGSFLLADRKVVDCYRQFNEAKPITFALIAWTGFDQAVVEYDRHSRQAGRSSWSFARLLSAMYDTFIGFSGLPVHFISRLGWSIFMLSALWACYLLVSWFLDPPSVAGWTTTMLMMSFFFGLQFLALGVMGQYLDRIHLQSVRRPLYFVAERTENGKDGDQHHPAAPSSHQIAECV